MKTGKLSTLYAQVISRKLFSKRYTTCFRWLVHASALHFPGFFFLSSLILKEFSSEGQIFVNCATIIYFKLLIVINTCSQEAWKFLHNKKPDFSPCNSSVRSVTLGMQFSVRNFQWNKLIASVGLSNNVECSVISYFRKHGLRLMLEIN